MRAAFCALLELWLENGRLMCRAYLVGSACDNVRHAQVVDHQERREPAPRLSSFRSEIPRKQLSELTRLCS
jgi:hypothetical protein